MKLSKFSIKEEKKYGFSKMNIVNDNGDYVGDVTSRNAYQSIEFRISGNEILARRHNYSKTLYNIIREGIVIGRFFKSGTHQSDIEFNLNGQNVSFSIFSNAGYKTAKILSNGMEIGLLSSKRNFLKVEYGLVINSDEHAELILVVALLHILYQSRIVLSDENIFI